MGMCVIRIFAASRPNGVRGGDFLAAVRPTTGDAGAAGGCNLYGLKQRF
jgi:hypothetical protein